MLQTVSGWTAHSFPSQHVSKRTLKQKFFPAKSENTIVGTIESNENEIFANAFTTRLIDLLGLDEFLCRQDPASLWQRLQKDWYHRSSWHFKICADILVSCKKYLKFWHRHHILVPFSTCSGIVSKGCISLPKKCTRLFKAIGYSKIIHESLFKTE